MSTNDTLIQLLLEQNDPKGVTFQLHDKDIVKLIRYIAKKRASSPSSVFNEWIGKHKGTLIRWAEEELEKK